MPMNETHLRRLLSDLQTFSRYVYPDRALRAYQLRAAALLLGLVRRQAGGTGVVLMARQSGKDETLAQTLAFLLARYRRRGGEIVFGTPTLRPQGLVSRRRLAERLETPLHPGAESRDGYQLRCGRCAVSFLSADPLANARGETANLLLVGNEAQDIDPAHWDAVFAPMTASTNAPQMVTGTPWLGGSLLSREAARADERGTAIRVPWPEVAAEVPAYGAHVAERIAQIGETHPFFRSEYCLVEPEGAGGLFPAARQAQMRGGHPRQHEGTPGHEYALLLDVGGGLDCGLQSAECGLDETGMAGRAIRDGGQAEYAGAVTAGDPFFRTPHSALGNASTALTVVAIDRTPLADPLVRRPAYRVVSRYEWVGLSQPALLPLLVDLATQVWRAGWLIGDATGIGAGLMAFLGRALRGRCRVVPFVFSERSKSDLGWAYLGCILSGRYKEYADDGAADTAHFWTQVRQCRYSVADGPGRVMHWGVPAQLGHDDLLVSAALVGALDEQDWTPRIARGHERGLRTED
jgi:hypothetical protein